MLEGENESIMQSCEEAMKTDPEYWKMIRKISDIHASLKCILNKKQLELLIELENMAVEIGTYEKSSYIKSITKTSQNVNSYNNNVNINSNKLI